MRNARRGFDSAKYVDKVRLRDLAGAAAAVRDSVDDASGGKGTSSTFGNVAAVFRRLRRRCGVSWIDGPLSSIILVPDVSISSPLPVLRASPAGA